MASKTEDAISPNEFPVSAGVRLRLDRSLALENATTVSNKRKIDQTGGQREDVYVRKPYVRKPHISVAPVKTLSEPRKVPGHVSRREVRKYTALPPPSTSTPANTTHKANRGGDDDGGGQDKGGDNSHNGDDGQGNDGNDGNDGSEEQEQAEINNAGGLDESEDDFESACSTPWPEDTFKELSAPERQIVPAAASEISELQTELFLLEESAREEQARIEKATEELTNEEKTRNYRIQQNLQSNLFVPYLKRVIDPPIYCLFADNRLVWRYEIKAQDTRVPYSSSIRRWRGRDRAPVSEGELEKAGWVWQEDGGVWERLPTPFEVSLSRRKQILSIKIVDEHR